MATLAGIIFVFMYMVIVSEKIHRTVAAVLGAVAMLLLGILSQEQAIHHVDFNTLGLLVGMMVLVGVTSHTGLFDYVAVKAAKVAKAEPRRLLIYLGLITAVFSAFLDNVTTVLLMVPVTFSITQKLHLKPIPFLLTQIIASNIGGTATLIGDPPNIMIGSAVKELTFVAFIENLAPIAFINLAIVIFIMEVIYRKNLETKPELQAEMMQMDEKESLKDMKLLYKALFVLGLTILGFFTHSLTHIENSTIALAGGFLLLLLAGGSHHLVESTMKSVEWATIFFFIGLFIAVGGLIETGIIGSLAQQAVELTGGDVTATSLLVLWLSAIVSSYPLRGHHDSSHTGHGGNGRFQSGAHLVEPGPGCLPGGQRHPGGRQRQSHRRGAGSRAGSAHHLHQLPESGLPHYDLYHRSVHGLCLSAVSDLSIAMTFTSCLERGKLFRAGFFAAGTNSQVLEGIFLARFGGSRGTGMCVLYVVIGAILGGLLGQLLSKVDVLSGFMPYLVDTYPVFDVAPSTFNLYVIQFTLGLAFAPNLISILGVVLAIYLFRRFN